ncbi:FAD-binding oxidoreductase [Micrococcoides hystricis]|uniref:FAD-binding oxidoreductase n=1 Tax=Micrococcoides hystricis TaxID=1572761 RepID=A0ABV6P8Y9_9MICC
MTTDQQTDTQPRGLNEETLAQLAELTGERFSGEAEILRQHSCDELVTTEDSETVAAVVYAETVDDVQQVMRFAYEHDIPVITRGAGTGVSGGAHGITGAIALSLERMNRIISINPDDEMAVVEPGVINAQLNDAAAEHGFMYAPDPASYQRSTIGGNIATNAGGLRCAKYGVTRDSVRALDVVLADGTLISTGSPTFKGVAGYDLTSLFVGSEGTLGVVVSATVRLRYLSETIHTVAAFFEDFVTASEAVLAIGRGRVQPSILEIMDLGTMAALDEAHGSDLSARGKALLLIQTDGFGADREAEAITAILQESATEIISTLTASDPSEALALVDLRRHSRGDNTETVVRVGEDVAVPKSQLVNYVHRIYEIADKYNVLTKVVAHAGDGNLHPTFWIDADDYATGGMSRLDQALDESIRAALDFNGTITAEHGIGSYKLRWLGWEQSPEVQKLQRQIKEVFDPKNILNPGRAIL